MTTVPTKMTAVDVYDLSARVKQMYRGVALHPGRDYHFETGRALAERLGYATSSGKPRTTVSPAPNVLGSTWKQPAGGTCRPMTPPIGSTVSAPMRPPPTSWQLPSATTRPQPPRNHVDTALALMQRALHIAKGSDLDTRALRARYCEVLTDHGDYELGSSIALDLLPVLEEEMDPLLVDVSLALMLCQFNLGHDFTLTVDHLSEVLSGLPAGPDRARALGVVGMVQVMRQTPESMRQAIATGEEILRLGSAHGFELATAHMVRGRARLALGEADAMTELEDALHSMTALDSPFVMAGGWQWVAGASHHNRPRRTVGRPRVPRRLSSSRGIQSLVSMVAEHGLDDDVRSVRDEGVEDCLVVVGGLRDLHA